MYTCQSEIGKIKSVFIKRAQEAFLNEAHLEKEWKKLNYLARPDWGKALEEYDDFETLAVGQTYRTSKEGLEQLQLALAGIKIMTVPLPHYKGPEDVFHLMSVFSPVDTNLAVLDRAGVKKKFRKFDIKIDR